MTLFENAGLLQGQLEEPAGHRKVSISTNRRSPLCGTGPVEKVSRSMDQINATPHVQTHLQSTVLT